MSIQWIKGYRLLKQWYLIQILDLAAIGVLIIFYQVIAVSDSHFGIYYELLWFFWRPSLLAQILISRGVVLEHSIDCSYRSSSRSNRLLCQQKVRPNQLLGNLNSNSRSGSLRQFWRRVRLLWPTLLEWHPISTASEMSFAKRSEYPSWSKEY